jgi:hypothetical protein
VVVSTRSKRKNHGPLYGFLTGDSLPINAFLARSLRHKQVATYLQVIARADSRFLMNNSHSGKIWGARRQFGIADSEMVHQGQKLDQFLQTLSDFLDGNAVILDAVRRDGRRVPIDAQDAQNHQQLAR